MIVNFNLLYKNGHAETLAQEGKEELFNSIINTVNTSFRDDETAVIRFSDGKETTMVRVADLSKINFTIVEGGNE